MIDKVEKFERPNHTLIVEWTNGVAKAYRVSPQEGVSIFEKMSNLAKASVNHILKGRPQATQEKIDKRFTVCETCEYLIKRKMECSKCGCGIRSIKGKISKLSWDDSTCPVGKW